MGGICLWKLPRSPPWPEELPVAVLASSTQHWIGGSGVVGNTCDLTFDFIF